MVEWSNFISSVGFPIACSCALGFVLWQMWKHVKTTCDKLTETNAELTYTNKELVKTNSNLVSSINVKLDKLIEKIK